LEIPLVFASFQRLIRHQNSEIFDISRHELGRSSAEIRPLPDFGHFPCFRNLLSPNLTLGAVARSVKGAVLNPLALMINLKPSIVNSFANSAGFFGAGNFEGGFH